LVLKGFLEPAPLLRAYSHLLYERDLPGPILDLACGDGHNGLFLAMRRLPVVFCDRSLESLNQISLKASEQGMEVEIWHVDLEVDGINPLPDSHYGAVLAFRYLHRPLMPHIKAAVGKGGYVFYETYTVEQPRFGRPHNPDFLLKPGELLGWFDDWQVIHYFEGERQDPPRAVAQIVCLKSA
jgi:SAM-dependent methyltransferase